jgi:hypothetical protein
MTQESGKIGIKKTQQRSFTAARRALMAVATMTCFTLLSARANACGPSSNQGPQSAVLGSQFVRALAAAQPSFHGAKAAGPASIVGLWLVKFESGGQPWDEGFDQWQSDGTEILNDNAVPPAQQNLCLGVFEYTGSTYKLKHPVWNWDANGNLIGSGILKETITLESGNVYKGSFEYDTYDLNGNLTGTTTGTLKGQRINVD